MKVDKTTIDLTTSAVFGGLLDLRAKYLEMPISERQKKLLRSFISDMIDILDDITPEYLEEILEGAK